MPHLVDDIHCGDLAAAPPSDLVGAREATVEVDLTPLVRAHSGARLTGRGLSLCTQPSEGLPRTSGQLTLQMETIARCCRDLVTRHAVGRQASDYPDLPDQRREVAQVQSRIFVADFTDSMAIGVRLRSS